MQYGPYTLLQTLAVCDALNTLLNGASIDTATWLKVVAPSMLSRAMRVDLAWDEELQRFKILA